MEQKEYISKLSPHLFWDIDISKADMDTCPAQIIQRVLEYGTLADWLLIRSYYGLDKIVSVCKSLRSLDRKALAYICCISNTSKEKYHKILFQNNAILSEFTLRHKTQGEQIRNCHNNPARHNKRCQDNR